MKFFPTGKQRRADSIGADELMALLEWILRNRPRALKNARTRHSKYLRSLLSQVERHGKARR